MISENSPMSKTRSQILFFVGALLMAYMAVGPLSSSRQATCTEMTPGGWIHREYCQPAIAGNSRGESPALSSQIAALPSRR